MDDPTMPPYGVEFIGPFHPSFRVSVDGYRVPYVDVCPVDGSDSLFNVCVGSHSVLAELGEIQRWMPFLANAMAWSAGYTSHGKHSQLRNDFNLQTLSIGEVDTESP